KPGGLVIVTTPYSTAFRETLVDRQVYERQGEGRKFFERHYDDETLRQRLLEPAGGDVLSLEYWGERALSGERLLSVLGPLRTPLSPAEALLAKLCLRQVDLQAPGVNPLAVFFTLGKRG